MVARTTECRVRHDERPLGLHRIWSSDEPLESRFKCVYPAPTSANHSCLARADMAYSLVLVHGHSGDAFSTWKHENGKSWPDEFLPLEDKMKNIVVWTWGYRAIEEKSQGDEMIVPNTIFGLGEELCSILHDNQVHVSFLSIFDHSIIEHSAESASTTPSLS
jgi:hypothetical protein